MGRREDLLREEAEGWEELNALIARLSPEQLERPGYAPAGWSVKDLMWHIARWSEDTARVLGEMRAGTWDGLDPSEDAAEVERLNRAWFEESRTMDPEAVRAGWHAARARLLEAFGTFEQLTADVDEWFDETGPIHYRKHLPDLRAWVERLTF